MKTAEIQLLKKKKVNPCEVIFMEADVNYTKVYLENGKNIYLAKTLKKLSEHFNYNNSFFRSHKSFIINLNFIDQIKETEILMKNQHKVLLSRRKKEELRNLRRFEIDDFNDFSISLPTPFDDFYLYKIN